ncbi:hypothetical protein BJ138DRAFT_1156591 [Hygrophoropsis aurantiaca]|uniref:Uncharacterized protein n=1 Tax=Hygrophoropsis aurantiaca TaxID=72124 RepID=A0ACB8A676_9AGAM|nr:hypothetical protein BJ138DRAFT_1156591 [Hygrophoropsis aurantiaca]
MALHPLLCYDPTARLMFNVTRDTRYVQLRPECSPRMLQAPALTPPVPRLLITITGFPAWAIEVVNPRGVTVSDVLGRIFDTLNCPVSQQEITQYPAAMVTSAGHSFRARTQMVPQEYAQGVKRVDFIAPKVFFVGLTKCRSGHDRWEVHFSMNV